MDERLGRFKDEADAFAQCEMAGYTAHKFDFPADDNEFHWHDFDSLTFITAGELTIFDVDSGESRTCGAGSIIVRGKGVIDREQTWGCRASVGFAENPSTVGQPINETLPVTV